MWPVIEEQAAGFAVGVDANLGVGGGAVLGVVGRVAVAALDDGDGFAGRDVGDAHADAGRDAVFGASPLVFDPPLAISAGAFLDEHVARAALA